MPVATVDQFLARLAKRKPEPAILLLGTDQYLRDLCRKKLVEASVPEGAREWAVRRFSAADDPLQRALSQAQTLPMLAPRQVVFVEDLEVLESLGEDAREEGLERLAAYLEDPAPFTVLVLEAPRLDERRKLFKRLTENVLVVSVELPQKPEERDAVAAQMALRMAREIKVELGQEAARELADLLNGNLGSMRSELEKLATYVGERGEVQQDDIEELVISAKKYSVWELADMLASGQRSRALEFLDSLLREGEQPAALVGAMAWMYRKLIEAQELPGHLSGWLAARQLRMRPKTAELALEQSRKVSRRQLLEGLLALSEADDRLKSGPADERAVMEFLVASLTGAVARGRA